MRGTHVNGSAGVGSSGVLCGRRAYRSTPNGWVNADVRLTVPGVADDDIGFPVDNAEERELLLQWLGYLREAVLRDAGGLDDEQARWRPEGRLISIAGVINHLTRVEWRWIGGAFHGAVVNRTESEFAPGSELSLDAAVLADRERAAKTEAAVRAMPLEQVSDPSGWAKARAFDG